MEILLPAQSILEIDAKTVDYESTNDFDLSQLELKRKYAKLVAKWEIFLNANTTLNDQIQIFELTLSELKIELAVKDELIFKRLSREYNLTKELEDRKKMWGWWMIGWYINTG